MRPIVFAVSAFSLLFLAIPSGFATPGACRVTKISTMKNGTMKKKVYRTKAGTPEDCAEDAELQTTNFFSPKISRVDVHYQFGDGPAKKAKGAKE